MLILSMFTVFALTYNFPANNNFLNINSNNSFIGIGNFNNTHVLVSNINGTVDKININTLANDGKLSNVGLCNSSTSSSKHIIMKLLDNSTICSEQVAFLGYNSVGTLILSTSNVNNIGIGVTKYNSSQYYVYYIYTTSIQRVSPSSLATVGFNCLATFNNTMFNDYGITVNSLTNDNFFAQDDFDRFFFKFGNRYFFINESATTNISSCSNMVVEEAFITTTNVSSTDTNIIMNDTLFINTKNSANQTNLYTSSNVDIHSGLVLYNGVWYKNDSVCFNSVSGYGFFNASGGNLQCTSFSSGGYCNSNLSICSAGCTYDDKVNIHGVNYREGVCASSNCSNTCGVLGQVRSVTLSSYQICAIGSSGCAEWSNSISCLPNQISTNGVCDFVNTSINYITRLGYSVNPYTAVYIPNTNPPVFNINLWNVSYNPTTTTLTAITNTGLGGSGSFPLYIQVPYQFPSYFLGIDCDYKSTTNSISISQNEIRNNVPVEVINGTRDFIINGQNRGYQKLTLILDNNINETEFSVSVEDVNTKVIQTTYYVVNKTNGEIIAYQDDKTGSVLYTQTFTTGFSLGKVEIELYEDFNNLQANNMLSLYRFVDFNNQPLLFTRGVGVIPYKDNLATTPYKIVLTNYSSNLSVSMVLNEIITSSLSQVSSLISGTSIDYVNGYDSTSCIYLNDGTYKARFYLMERAGNQFFSINDITIVKQDVSTAQQTGGNTKSGFNFSVLTKIFIAIGSSLLVSLFFIVMGFINDNDTARKVFIFIGLFAFVIGLVAFTIARWIPAWIVILGIIIAGLGVGIFFISKSNGSD